MIFDCPRRAYLPNVSQLLMNKKESKKALLPKLHQTTLGNILETAPFFQFEDNDIK